MTLKSTIDANSRDDADAARNDVRTQAQAPMTYRALEPRIAFDAAIAETVDHANETQAPVPAPDATVAPTLQHADIQALSGLLAAADASAASHADGAAAGGSTIVFIDAAVTSPTVIAAAAPEGAEIVVLEAGRDGVAQIASHLAGRHDIDAVHIVSHGSAGELKLGSASLTIGSLSGTHADEMAVIRAALSADADILVYGCDVAAGERGQAFVAALSLATGADVAASSDDTGAAARGGDWDLETRTGLIEAGLIDAPEWNGLLAPLNIRVTGNPILSGPGGGAYDPFNSVGNSALWTNAGTVGDTPVDVRATVVGTTTFNAGVNPTPYVDFITSNTEDFQLILWNGTATIRWEIFATGTNQTVYAAGSPNFSIRDLDGTGTSSFPALPAIELEAVAPSLYGLTGYSVEGNPLAPYTLNVGIVGSDLIAAGTINRNAEPNSMVIFHWTEVSSWEVKYSANTAFVNPDNTISARFYYHDGDGDFTFVSAARTNLLNIDLDADDSTATTTSYQTTFTENCGAVAVVDSDVSIAQHAALGTSLHEATVRLVNPQPNDQLLVNGSTNQSGTVTVSGATFAYTITTSGGYTEVVFTGTATPAQYQQALQTVAFRNTSESPSTINRQIEVFVTNRIDLGDTRGGCLRSGIGDGIPGCLGRRCLECLVADPDRHRAPAASADQDDVAATVAVGPLTTARLPGRDAQLRWIEARLVRQRDPLQRHVDPQCRQLASQIEEQRASLSGPSIKYPSRHISPHASHRWGHDEAVRGCGDDFDCDGEFR